MNEGGKTTRSDIWGGVGWVLFGLVILAESLRMDRFTSMGATIYTMPGFVPGMIGVVVMVLGLVACVIFGGICIAWDFISGLWKEDDK